MKNQTINQTIKTNRVKYGLTQHQLAQQLGCSESTISRWEDGSRFPRFKMLVKLSELFNLTIPQLFKTA